MERLFFFPAVIVFFSVAIYHFLIADIYLYHTLMVLPALCLFAVALISSLSSRILWGCIVLWVLFAGWWAGVCPAIVGGNWINFRPLAIELPATTREAILLSAGGKNDPRWPDKFKERFLLIQLGDAYRM